MTKFTPKSRIALLAACAALFAPLFAPLCAASAVTERPDVQAFIKEMTGKHQFKIDLNALFAQVEIKPAIIAAMQRPAEAKPWYEYRPIFLTEERIRMGVEFWNKHEKVIAQASAKYGVDPEIIVAIIGVETRYGQHAGAHRVIDALTTLAFDYPKRAEFFRSELEHYLLMVNEERFDPLALKGSYAGAMGVGQFMPSSYRHYAVDFDNDGQRNLFDNMPDAIGSVANYFREHKWQLGQPVIGRAKPQGKLDEAAYDAAKKAGPKPTLSYGDITKLGIELLDDLPREQPMSLIELAMRDGPSYWVGLQNFYVITRYNRSPLYAMAVYQLSQEIKARHGKAAARKPT
ncbi:MAG: lytic murein transglycosylase B [Pseudomonadota bacterium]